MRRVSLFAEDFGHEEFLKTLLSRLAGEYKIEVAVEVRSASGGQGRALRELRDYVRDLWKTSGSGLRS